MKILFMCVANSARSQLAEGLAKVVFPGGEIQSAGSNPGKLNPFAVQAMNEIGIDISRQHSKSTEELSPKFIATLDYVITLCAEEVCPIMISDAKKLHWPLPDPAGSGSESELIERFRRTRDEIKKRLEEFKKKIRVKT